MIDKEKLLAEAAEYGVELNDKICGQLDLYARLLVEWNQKYNLTAITDPEEIRIKHFLDSLLAVQRIPVGEILRVIDVGTGAGFPGAVLKIARPDIKLTLLDSAGKRIRFLKSLCGKLDISCEFVQARAEMAARQEEYRECFDVVVSRGVAGLPSLCEYCLPFARVGGIFLAMKGSNGRTEAEEAEHSAETLGARLAGADEFQLPDGSARIILSYRKEVATIEKYPRVGAQISKRPL